ncbi:hypothetical protein [Streptomyces yaizuensis]|uniref:Uncharacterized protein n=1 Tax=Streptomyces yaizuensis TaxID=2989713 RepID=A0ABQ5P7L5_9ACTN|nr:hypothetical protein [Streptomyces sp. YSPA8]GLF98569.1 hypothetical protein SYYSPA8_29750 [Streptomyces sp. YSPA8]
MEAELVALATAGAAALVQQMVQESWGPARERLARFFSRGAADPDTVTAELETSRAELLEAQEEQDEEAAADVLAEWRVRMRRTLRDDPEAAAELRTLLEEIAPAGAAGTTTVVHNTISGGTQHGTVIQAGTIGQVHQGR